MYGRVHDKKKLNLVYGKEIQFLSIATGVTSLDRVYQSALRQYLAFKFF